MSNQPHGSIYPIVQVQAWHRGSLRGEGVGFFTRPWDSWVITARHVLMQPDGGPPDEVRIIAWNGSQEIELDAVDVGFLPRESRADLAVVRMRQRFESMFTVKGLALGVRAPVQIKGYLREDMYAATAKRYDHWIGLTRVASPGMSGSPVLLVPADGRPRQVIAVYTGKSMGTLADIGAAYALDPSVIARCQEIPATGVV